MSTYTSVDINTRAAYDEVITSIARYVVTPLEDSQLAFSTAGLCLMDTLGCGILALQYPACRKLLGPIVPGTVVPNGVRVPGTRYQLDPIQAAFNIGTLIRWLDYNDTWLAAEWGHPSDNLGAILAVTDYVSQERVLNKRASLTVRDVLSAMIKAHEIQGILALENSFNRLGFDHVILVRIASTALATFLLGGTEQQIADAISQAWLDGAALRTYRHAPNTGSRKSWAAGDATSRGVKLAWMTMQGEMGYSSALTAKKWGFYDVIMKGNPLKIARKYGTYVMENVLFKISYPAEFHAQTAVECAVTLHPHVRDRLDQIDKIILTTHESAIRIISKSGPLHNPADRDHCLQYMVAVALLHGDLRAEHYEDGFANDPRIDQLRDCMFVQENQQFSIDYLDPNKRSIANAMQIIFKDGASTDTITIEYPIGHRLRRDEGIPLMYHKFEKNMLTLFSKEHTKKVMAIFQHLPTLEKMAIQTFMELFIN